MAVTYNMKGTSNDTFLVGNSSTRNTITLSSSTTGSNPTITATGLDTNIGIDFVTKGTGAFSINGLEISNSETSVNNLVISGGDSGNPVVLLASGTDSDVGMEISAKANGKVRIDNIDQCLSYDTGIGAAGTTQNGATQLSGDIGYNLVSIVSATASGVKLPSPRQAGHMIIITNDDAADSLSIYPNNGHSINSLSANAAISISAGTTIMIVASSTSRWHTMNATYA